MMYIRLSSSKNMHKILPKSLYFLRASEIYIRLIQIYKMIDLKKIPVSPENTNLELCSMNDPMRWSKKSSKMCQL